MGCHQADAAEQAMWRSTVNDRRVLNGIFWVLRSGVPWRDLPNNFGPYPTCYNRFVRWRRAESEPDLHSPALPDLHSPALKAVRSRALAANGGGQFEKC
jgi:transposase